MTPLLVSEAVGLTTIGTLPGNTITRESPEIFFHAILAQGKPAATMPEKWCLGIAAGAVFCSTFSLLTIVFLVCHNH